MGNKEKMVLKVKLVEEWALYMFWELYMSMLNKEIHIEMVKEVLVLHQPQAYWL